MANKYLAKGAKITVAISAVQTIIAGATKITPPESVFDTWDSTDLSDSGTVKTPTGYDDPGKCSFEFLFDSKNAAHDALMTAHYAKTLKDFVMTGPTQDPYTYTFSAYVTKITPSSEVKKGQMGTCELELPQLAVYAKAP